MSKVKVQLSIHPEGHLHEVDEDELPQLRADGLLVEDDEPEDARPAAKPEARPPAASVPAATAKPAASAAPSKE